MHRNKIIRFTIASTSAVVLLGLAGAPALAHDDRGREGSSWSWSGSYDGGQRGRAASYINPDTGAATANPDVDPGSSCYRQDQLDKQMFSDPGSAARNVHNDACFLDRDGKKLNGPASFQSSGVGFISACPDPDGAGPEFARLSDTNGDGRMDLCFQSSFQMKGVAGDMEFHARLNNNTAMAGRQTVVWCSDADQDGCRDEWNKSTIQIDWSADGRSSFGGSYGGWGG